MSSSSSEDEINEALKESANCDYINRLVNPTNNGVAPKPAKPFQKHSSNSQTDVTDKDGEFETFIARRLAGRLNEKIKIVEKPSQSDSDNSKTEGGIKLFSSSPIVRELKESHEDEVPLKKRKAPPQVVIDYHERAAAVSVSHEWVKDKSNIVHWKDNKRPRILETTVIKSHANGTIECLPVTKS